MEYLTSPGEACFTGPEARKLTGRISKLGYRINEIRGVWIYYTHLKQSDQDTLEVRLPSSCLCVAT
jgi:phosphoribosylformylglycinamidine synthase